MILRKKLDIEKPKECSRNKRSVRMHNGSIMILFTVVLMVMIGLTALALDVQHWISQKHSLQNVSDNMSISALDCYYNNQSLNDLIVGLTVQEQVEARITSGMRCAQNVFNASANVLMDKDKMAEPVHKNDEPFLGEDWQDEYEDLMESLQEGDSISFSEGHYRDSAVKFLDKDDAHVIPSNLPANVTSELVLKSKVNFAYNEDEHVQPILADALTNIGFQPSTDSEAEVVNLGLTRCMVLAMDRSFSMTNATSSAPRHSAQFPGVTLQPMKRLVDAAKILPDILADLNQFRDPSLNNSFGIVMFDAVAEAVEFDSGPGDPNEHLSHDEGHNRYQDVMDVLNLPVTGDEVPRIGNIASDFKIENPVCNQFHCPVGGPCPTDSCNHDNFRTLDNFKQQWFNRRIGGNPYTPSTNVEDLWRLRDPSKPNDRYLGTFSPWTQTDGSIGLEVAIEIIRQERERLRQLFGEAFVDKKFSGEIVALSDLIYNIFHDRNAPLAGIDPFPNGHNNPLGTYYCDDIGIINSTIPGFTPRLYDLAVYPASWRERVSQPRAYGDVYHNSTTFFDISTGYDPDHPPVGFEPLGVETNRNISHSTIYQNAKPCASAGGPNCCPGPDCAGNVTSCGSNASNCKAGNATTDTYAGNAIPNTSSVRLYCADLAVMDYARWAEANEITIHGLGFELPASGWQRSTRLYLLNYMSDPAKDGKRVGLVFTDVNCTSSGCPSVEQAFKKIGRNIEIRISNP